MIEQKNKPKTYKTPSPEMENVAERYLDFWQENVRLWATDSDALEKWVTETARQLKSSNKNPI